MLAFAAGAVNAGALLACQRFVSHVTGSITLIGVDARTWWLAADYALVLGCFVLGAAASVLAIEAQLRAARRPLHHVPLVVVAAVVAATAWAGHVGAFGAFGGAIEQPPDFVLLSVLGFAMGLQNATVATSTGMAIRTTHMTGPATDVGVALGTAFVLEGQERVATLRAAAMRAGKIVAFALGGLAMVPLCAAITWLSFLLPAVTVAAATVLSFVPRVRS